MDESAILNLHKILLSKTDLPYGGIYKTHDNVIRETYFDGTSRIHFSPVSAKDTKETMVQLILTYQEARDDSGIDQLLLIPCFILDFLCIHPFRDGNGRMSRLLTLLLLYKADFDISKYIYIYHLKSKSIKRKTNTTKISKRVLKDGTRIKTTTFLS